MGNVKSQVWELKSFLDRVEELVQGMSPEDLQGMIRAWANETPSNQRGEFLNKLAPPAPAAGSAGIDEELLTEIQELYERVESEDLCEGYGWDPELHEERDFGDESWADDVDDFFARAFDALQGGNPELAAQAYDGIFGILAFGEETGHLPGPEDPTELLVTDLDEARARYLRATYLAANPTERASALLEVIRQFDFLIGDKLNLRAMLNAGQETLPDFPQFVVQWEQALKQPKGPVTGHEKQYLLREATLLRGGTTAIGDLARQEGTRQPLTYVEWIDALICDGNLPAAVCAADEALKALPEDLALRGKVGEKLAQIGESLADQSLQVTGWREAFCSNPTLKHLLSRLSAVGSPDSWGPELEDAITRVKDLISNSKSRKEVPGIRDPDLQASSGSVTLLVQAYLMAGRYSEALDACAKEQSLGWSSPYNSKGLVVPFLLTVTMRCQSMKLPPNVTEIWKEAVNTSEVVFTDNFSDILSLRQALAHAMEVTALDDEDANGYIEWCTAEVKARVNAIVGNQHRGSYGKAAKLLGALAEVLESRGRLDLAQKILSHLQEKYSRYSAFQRELRNACSRSKTIASL